jgi:site-specific DNA-methyltransferase (adenine-specific)
MNYTNYNDYSIIGNSQVYNMDCMEALRQTPDKYYDLAIVDPPYGIGRDGSVRTTSKHGGRKAHKFKGWDKEIPNEEYFNQLFRVSKNQIIWGANYFTTFLPPSMGWIFWDKGQRICNSDGELAYTSFKSALRVVTINRVELLLEGTTHPTQKPIKLYKWLLSNYAKVGDKILDTHLGSGSSRIAAYDLGFDFTGFELDKDYFDAQEKRFANHLILHGNDMFKPETTITKNQQSLF